MNTQVIPLKIKVFNNIFNLLKNDLIFSVSLFLAFASSIFSSPKLSYIDFKVLVSLFNLMIVVKAFEELHILDKFAVSIVKKSTNSRHISMILIALSFFSSMLITNDIALITFVPITLIVSKKSNLDLLETVILQTLAANIGSSLTPIGNPQNLFIFSYYKLTASQFFPPIILFTGLGLGWLCFLNYFRKKQVKIKNVALETKQIKAKSATMIWTALFVVVVLSVFGIMNYKAAQILTLTTTLLVSRKLALRVDYTLLLTFVCFFIFIGNISGIPAISNYMKAYLNSSNSTYFSSILLSQFISNVPCAVFLSKFTPYWKELLLGVNIGGMGTIIASLASVISYKLFIKNDPQNSKKYILKFGLYNILSLAVFTLINYLAIIRR